MKVLFFLNRAAERAAELIALKARDGAAVEEIARVEGVVAQKLVERAVELVAFRTA